MRSVFLGAPGSGKGTQAGIISKRLGISHIASGDLFREAASRGDEVGNQAKSYMEKGLLVPDEITIRICELCYDALSQMILVHTIPSMFICCIGI